MARRKVIEWLIQRLKHEVDDKHFRMDYWLSVNDKATCYYGEHDIPFCKTAGCLAGTLFLGLPEKLREAYAELRARGSADILEAATEQLGLSEKQAQELFLPDVYALKLIKRKHAINVLKRMLTHSEINWAAANDDLSWGHCPPTLITLTDD